MNMTSAASQAPVSHYPHQVTKEGLIVEVPAGGGCPNYSATLKEAPNNVTVLLQNRGDSCKGWFPDEKRLITIPWTSLGLKSRPSKNLVIQVVPQ